MLHKFPRLFKTFVKFKKKIHKACFALCYWGYLLVVLFKILIMTMYNVVTGYTVVCLRLCKNGMQLLSPQSRFGLVFVVLNGNKNLPENY